MFAAKVLNRLPKLSTLYSVLSQFIVNKEASFVREAVNHESDKDWRLRCVYSM